MRGVTMELTTNLIISSLRRVCEVLHDNRQYLTDLDSPIGDADHGINMDRGFMAVLPKLDTVEGQDAGAILNVVTLTVMSAAGGASCSLYGTALLRGKVAARGKLCVAADLCLLA